MKLHAMIIIRFTGPNEGGILLSGAGSLHHEKCSRIHHTHDGKVDKYFEKYLDPSNILIRKTR